MFLGDKLELKINNWVLRADFRFLKNLYNYINTDPINWLFNDWLSIDYMDDGKLNTILQCMTSELIDFRELFADEETKTDIVLGLATLIQTSFKIKTDNNSKSDADNIDSNTNNDTESKFDFEDWFNRYYYIAVHQLNLSYDEFLSSTVAEIATLEHLDTDHKKAVLIGAYVDIETAKAKASKPSNNNNRSTKSKPKTTTINASNNKRIAEIWR